MMKGLEGEADTNQDNRITVTELYDYLVLKVKRQAEKIGRTQTPQIYNLTERVIAEW